MNVPRILMLTLIIAIAVGLGFLSLVPNGRSKSHHLAEAKFYAYCNENKYDCSGFEGPFFIKAEEFLEEKYRIYEFRLNDLIFEVRVPYSRLGSAKLGYTMPPDLVMEYFSGHSVD